MNIRGGSGRRCSRQGTCSVYKVDHRPFGRKMSTWQGTIGPAKGAMDMNERRSTADVAESNLEVADLVETVFQPEPVRYWWLKRVAASVGFLIAVLVALRVWWGWEANRRFQAVINRYIASGQPVHPDDFNPKAVLREKDNAAAVLLDAVALVRMSTEESLWLESETVTFGRPKPKDAEPILNTNAEVFKRIRGARDLKRADWGERLRSPVFATPVGSPQDVWVLKRLLCVQASYLYTIGDLPGAIESLRDLRHLVGIISQRPFFVSQRFSFRGEYALAFAIETMLPSLVHSSGRATVPALDPTSLREGILALMDDLLHEKSLSADFGKAILSQRMCWIDALQDPASIVPIALWATTSTADRAWLWFVGPAFRIESIPWLEFFTECYESANALDWARMRRALASRPVERRGAVEHLTQFRQWFYPSYSDQFVILFQQIALRRLTSTALAIALFQMDKGHLPVTLNELVPEYLPAIPADPFSPEGASIRYLPGAARPLLYSIGPDGLDNGGEFLIDSYGDIDIDRLDLPFFLDGARPTTQSAGG